MYKYVYIYIHVYISVYKYICVYQLISSLIAYLAALAMCLEGGAVNHLQNTVKSNIKPMLDCN